MYVCVCVCTYVCVYVSMYLRIYIYTYIYMYICMCVYMYIYIYMNYIFLLAQAQRASADQFAKNVCIRIFVRNYVCMYTYE